MNDILNSEQKKIRINKFLSKYGYCSRRHGDELIKKGLVFINNEVATLGSTVSENDKVFIKDNLNFKKINQTIKPIYIAFNKPLGITCTTCKKDKSNIIDFINYKERIFPIGRLDKNSYGLILLTNDGDIVNKILRSENNHEKEYLVKVDKPLTPYFINKMKSGVIILGQKTKPCKIIQLDEFSFKITLTQGLNRQIRRMCDQLNFKVTSLKRIRILNIKLGNLKIGEYRHLTNLELNKLFSLIKH